MSKVQGVNERDWKLFKSKLPDWQENYMDRLLHEYMEILGGEGSPSGRFWALEKRIRNDKRDTGVMVEDMSRSNMLYHIMSLVREGAIGMEDLGEFSAGRRSRVGGDRAGRGVSRWCTEKGKIIWKSILKCARIVIAHLNDYKDIECKICLSFIFVDVFGKT